VVVPALTSTAGITSTTVGATNVTSSDGIASTRSTPNRSAFTGTGNGTGNGAVLTGGGSAGNGGLGIGGAGSGIGLNGVGGPTNGTGVAGTGSGTGNGVLGIGGPNSGIGGNFEGGGPNGAGVSCAGAGSGPGITVGTGHAVFTGGNPASNAVLPVNTLSPKNFTKVWVNFTGIVAPGSGTTPVSANDGVGVASIACTTNNSYIITFTNPMANTAYSWFWNIDSGNPRNGSGSALRVASSAKTTSSITVYLDPVVSGGASPASALGIPLSISIFGAQ
jgi:hypothetical protein